MCVICVILQMLSWTQGWKPNVVVGNIVNASSGVCDTQTRLDTSGVAIPGQQMTRGREEYSL